MDVHLPPRMPLNRALVANMELDLTGPDVQVFTPLLQRGVFVRIDRGTTVRSFLCQALELTADFVEQCISTIFLNGRPVDSLKAKLKHGDTLALSPSPHGGQIAQ